jgi:hypothetical protein
MEDIGTIIVWDCLLNVRGGMPTQTELHSRLRTSFHVALFSSVDIAPSYLMLSTNPAEWESKAIWNTTPDLAITRRLGCDLSLWLRVLQHHTSALCCLVILRSSSFFAGSRSRRGGRYYARVPSAVAAQTRAHWWRESCKSIQQLPLLRKMVPAWLLRRLQSR